MCIVDVTTIGGIGLSVPGVSIAGSSGEADGFSGTYHQLQGHNHTITSVHICYFMVIRTRCCECLAKEIKAIALAYLIFGLCELRSRKDKDIVGIVALVDVIGCGVRYHDRVLVGIDDHV